MKKIALSLLVISSALFSAPAEIKTEIIDSCQLRINRPVVDIGTINPLLKDGTEEEYKIWEQGHVIGTKCTKGTTMTIWFSSENNWNLKNSNGESIEYRSGFPASSKFVSDFYSNRNPGEWVNGWLNELFLKVNRNTKPGVYTDIITTHMTF